MTETIDQKFAATAKSHAARIAISDGQTELTFADVDQAVDQVALSLSKVGLKRNEPIIVMVSNEASDIISFLAVWRAGAVAVPLHRSSPGNTIDRLKTRLSSRFLLDRGLHVINRKMPPARPLLEGAGTIIFTSGSTGEPKGVVLSAARASAKLDMIQAMLDWRNGDNTFVNLQLTFSFGQWATWLTLLYGGTVHLRSQFDVREVQNVLEKNDIQRVPVIPSILRYLVDSAGTSRFNGYFMAGGEPLPASLGQRVLAAYSKSHLGDIYGLTETGTSDFFVRPDDYAALAGTIGRAGDSIEYRIDGETQELQIRSPWGMLGYLDAPDLTHSAMREGWFKTGDLATTEENGAVRLIGRSKDQIVRSGNKISPVEVETVFLKHEAIAAALAVGVPDRDRGEATHLALVLANGYQVSQSELREWAQDHLERYKLPDVFHFLKALPEGSTGKVDRRALRRHIEDTANQ